MHQARRRLERGGHDARRTGDHRLTAGLQRAYSGLTAGLQRAFLSQPPTPGLLVHSDRGGQYGGKAYRKLLHEHEALRSQSRRGRTR